MKDIYAETIAYLEHIKIKINHQHATREITTQDAINQTNFLDTSIKAVKQQQKQPKTMNEAFDDVLNIINSLPSRRFFEKSSQAKNLLEKSILRMISDRIDKSSEDVFAAIPLIEADRNQLLREAEASENQDRKAMYQRGVEIYNTQLENLYKGEI